MKVQNLFKYFLVTIFITGIPACSLNCDDAACECGTGGGCPYVNVTIDDYRATSILYRFNHQWENYNGNEVYANKRVRINLFSYHNRVAFYKQPKGVRFNGLFTNTAYACSPVEPEPLTNQDFLGLTITSNTDYDSLHPTGTDLKDLFITYGKSWEHYYDREPIDTPLVNYLNRHPKHFILHSPPVVLAKSPSQPSEHIFTFELELSDTTFTFDTPLLKIR